MAKKTKTPAAGAQTADNGGAPAGGTAPQANSDDKMAKARAARAAGGGAQGGDIFKMTADKDLTEAQKGVKLAPQAQVIKNAIIAGGPKGISRDDLVKALGPQGDKPGILVTRQPVGRIVTYYQKDLQSAGVVITKATPAAAPAAPAAAAQK